MSDKPRQFWISRRHMDFHSRPVKYEYEETRWYPSEQFEAMKLERDVLAAENERLRKALNRVQSHGLHHYEDCHNKEYDDQNCNCGMEQTELIVRKALEK